MEHLSSVRGIFLNGSLEMLQHMLKFIPEYNVYPSDCGGYEWHNAKEAYNALLKWTLSIDSLLE